MFLNEKRKNCVFIFLMIMLFGFALLHAFQKEHSDQFYLPLSSPVLYIRTTPAPSPLPLSSPDFCQTLSDFIQNDHADPLLKKQAEEMLLCQAENERIEKEVQEILQKEKMNTVTCMAEKNQIFLFSSSPVSSDRCAALFDLIALCTGIPESHIYFVQSL